MFKKLVLAVTLLFLVFISNPSLALEESSPVNVEEIFTTSKTIEGDDFEYPSGKAEMRLIRVEVEKGAVIPLHSHPIPLMGHIESGELTLKKEKGKSKTFKEGDSFVLDVNTPPHTMGNTGTSSAVMWVAVASAEGIPTLTPLE